MVRKLIEINEKKMSKKYELRELQVYSLALQKSVCNEFDNTIYHRPKKAK